MDVDYSESTIQPTAPSDMQDHNADLDALDVAAQAGDGVAFEQMVANIDWLQCSVADYVRAVRLALAAGAHLAARTLATKGAGLYPDSQELQKMARILAPPRVVKVGASPIRSLGANRAWLRAHAGQYRGRWVALCDGDLVAEGESAAEVWAHLDSIKDVMLTRVF